MEQIRQLAEQLGIFRDLPQTVLLWIVLYLVLGTLELRFAAEVGQSLTGRLRNLLLTAIAVVLGTCTSQALLRLFLVEGRLVPDRGFGFSLMAAALTALLTDLVFYGYHRLQHETKILWPTHELHHSDTELNVTTSLRAHWLDRLLQSLVIGLPVGWLVVLDQRAGWILALVLPSWHFLAHSNLRLRLGPLSPILCGPQVHRIHHSILPQHHNRNYAQFFPIIDVIFGTYFAPAKDEFPPTGTPQLASNASVATVMVRPLQLWWAMLMKPAANLRGSPES